MIEIVLTTNSGTVLAKSDRELRRLQVAFLEEAANNFSGEMESVRDSAMRSFAAHQRKRLSGRSLLSIMAAAMKVKTHVDRRAMTASIMMLDWNKVGELSDGPSNRKGGWPGLFEDNHEGRAHGSRNGKYGFCDLEQAKNLAEVCISWSGMPVEEAMQFRREVADVFAGKHGEGIMVRRDWPMFFAYPEFGDAGQFVNPHPGFEAWDIIRKSIAELRDSIGAGDAVMRGAATKAVLRRV